MLINEMSELAGAYASSLQHATPKVMADKLRRHLWTLTCQTDIVELTGVLDDFGGDKDVGANIGKAVVALFCLGHLMGMDAKVAIDTIASELGVPPDSKPAQKTGANTPPVESAIGGKEGSTPAERAKEGGGTQRSTSSAGDSHDKPGDDTGGDKGRRIETYRKAFADAKEKQTTERIWKAIFEDKELTGQEKFQLQTDKKEAMQRLK
ncbi:MAG: hypothetical protein C0402_05385 [Thermodesulfovibrio sp.]|nr:hypothetical protein [Thermodesulfovibrio sp.]